jgi:heme oxygenase
MRLRPTVAAWERSLALRSDLPSGSFVAERNRLPFLLQDLAALSAPNTDIPDFELPQFDGYAQLMGAMYVMEGSRLGGQLIARHVEQVLTFDPGIATNYFRGVGDRTGRMWKEFLEALERSIPDSETEEVILGAKKMFTAFGDCMLKQSVR